VSDEFDNLEFDDLRRRLEQATAPEGRAEGPLDAETASLREGWLALGELLSAAEPPAEEPLTLREPPRPRRRIARTAAVLAALGASLVIGATLAARWVADDPVVRRVPLPQDAASRSTEREEAQGEPVAEPVETASLDDRAAWDDPLDRRIALAAQRIVGVQQDWDRVDGAFGPLYSGLEEMAEELDESAL
jgi:hypothetical protein